MIKLRHQIRSKLASIRNLPRPMQIWLAILALALVAVIIGGAYPVVPRHSVAAYCEAVKQENVRLGNKPGSKTFKLGPLTSHSDLYSDFAESYRRIERVAPDAIAPDVKSLRQQMEKMDKDPLQSIGAGYTLGALGDAIEQYTREYCGK